MPAPSPPAGEVPESLEVCHRSTRLARVRTILSFVTATEQLETGQPVVSVLGEVDLASAPALEQTLLDVAEHPADEVIVDLSGCSFLDARGLRALLAMGERRRRSNRHMAIVLSNPNVMRIFQITRFDQRFAIYPTLAAALNRSATGLA